MLEPKDVGPIIMIVAVAVIIIVRQLLSHQRQMTAMLHRVNQQTAPTNESVQMQQDMQELKQLVHRQAIAIDDLTSKLAASPRQDPVQERLTETR